MARPNTNSYVDLKNGVTKIITVKGDTFLIDTAAKTIAGKYCWSKDHGYARAVTRTDAGLKTIYLHRLLCKRKNDKPHVDHINGDRTDCRRANLRSCDHSENLQNQKLRVDNTSGFKGVRWHSQTRKFAARVTARGKEIHIGLFKTAEEAAVAATLYRQKLHGEFARHA